MTSQLRNPDGTFRDGHEKIDGSGRKTREVELNRLNIFRGEFTEEEIKTIIVAPLKRQAIKGNLKAIEIILNYLVGKPSQPIDMTSDSIITVTVHHARSEYNDTGPA